MPFPHTIFFVPGITGSYLNPRLPAWLRSTAFPVWPNPVEVVATGFAKLRLAVPGEPGGHPTSYLLPGGPLVHFYSGWLEKIRRYADALGTIEQDWRREWVYDGARLYDAIYRATDLTTSPPRLCGIICHSRGGLVTRWALELLRRNGGLARVQRVFGLGVPHRGSILAVDNLNGPWDYSTDLVRLGQVVSQLTLNLVSYDNVLACTRSWPALYELLPDPVRTWLDPAEVVRLYDRANWPLTGHPPVADYLIDAQASWAALPDPPAEVDWVNVVGVGFATRIGAPTAAQMIAHESESVEYDGDGVVPAVSARLPGRPTIWTPTQHGAMGYDQRLINYVVPSFLNNRVSDNAIGGAILPVPDANTEGPGG